MKAVEVTVHFDNGIENWDCVEGGARSEASEGETVGEGKGVRGEIMGERWS